MIYTKKCGCKCGAKLTLMYSGKIELRNLEKSGTYHKSSAKNLMVSVEEGNPWMMVSMEEIPAIIKGLQEAYKEYEEFQEELKKQGKLEDFIQDNKVNLSEQNFSSIDSRDYLGEPPEL